MSNSSDRFLIGTLRRQLVSIYQRHQRRIQKEMSPLLYRLREEIKAQGQVGKGFGAWIDEGHIGISRRTADRWANEYAVSIGKRKRPPLDKSPKVAGAVRPFQIQFLVPKQEHKQLHEDVEFLGREAVPVIVGAVRQAAARKRRLGVENHRSKALA